MFHSFLYLCFSDNEEDIFLSKDVSPVEAIGYDCLEKLKTIQGLRILQRAARLGIPISKMFLHFLVN